MDHRVSPHARGRGGGIRPWLILVKLAGLTAAFGGLGALVAIGITIEPPDDIAGWVMLRDIMRAIFLPCVLGGLSVTILAGVALWLRQPRVFLSRRWFRVKALLLLVALPSLHLWARGRATTFYDAIDAGAIAELPDLSDRVTFAFATAIVILFGIAIIGRVKPRLGQ